MSVRVCFVSWIEYVSYVGESMFCILDRVFFMSVRVCFVSWIEYVSYVGESKFCILDRVCFICR